MVDLARYFLQFLADESCGNAPFAEGIPQLLRLLTDLALGRGQRGDLDLKAWRVGFKRPPLCPGQDRCQSSALHPALLPRLNTRAPERVLPGGVCRGLFDYYIDPVLCRACGACQRVCPTGSIWASAVRCTASCLPAAACCGACMEACRFAAVSGLDAAHPQEEETRRKMSTKLELKVNDNVVTAERGSYCWMYVRRAGFLCPCVSTRLEGVRSCRLCLVEVNTGRRSQLVASCLYPVEGELTVLTDSPRVNEARRFVLTLLLARYSDVQLIEELARRYGVKPVERLQAEPADCLLCPRCVRACAAQGTGLLPPASRPRKRVSPPFDEPPVDCVGCGACAEVCPLGAIKVEEGEGKAPHLGPEFTLVHCQSWGAIRHTGAV